jgi:hypothetical protein
MTKRLFDFCVAIDLMYETYACILVANLRVPLVLLFFACMLVARCFFRQYSMQCVAQH